MSGSSKTEGEASLRILAVSQDPSTLEQLQWALGSTANLEIQRDPVAAWSMVCAEQLDGVVIDADLPNRMASLLTGAFLRHQDSGRVGVITSADDPTTLMGIALREDRVELLYRPLDLEMVRETVLYPETAAVLDIVLP